MESLQDEERKQFRQFIDDYRVKRKSASGGQMPAREMLDAVGGDLSGIARQAMEAVVLRDDTPSHSARPPPI